MEAVDKTCPMCDNEEAQLLGGLGNLLHFRCRYCGSTYHTEATQTKEAEEHATTH